MYSPLNRSFARRIGKRLSNYRLNLLENALPKFLFSKDRLNYLGNDVKTILEIGSGMGDHLFNMMKIHPTYNFIAAEVYLNGIANILDFAETENRSNLLIWPNDVDLLLPQIPNGLLDEIHILFPDPWPKRKQIKKRLVNELRLNQFSAKLKSPGKLIFASDIAEYFNQVSNLINHNQNFSLGNNESSHGYLPTKYHNIALKEGRGIQFLQAIKL